MNRRSLRILVIAGFGALAALMAALVSGSYSDVPAYDEVKARWVPSDSYLLDRNGELIHSLRVDFGVRRFEWVALDEISPALVEAVVDGEDRRFWDHSGVDWAGILGAVKDYIFRNRTRGASTITMQVASLIDAGVPERGGGSALKRKWIQIRIAQGIERHWDKRQILEAYLNLLDYRGELRGIGAAARALAAKAPSGLNLPESLVLAALLPAPSAAHDRIVARACARSAARSLPVSCETIRSTAAVLLAQPANAYTEAQAAPHVARMLLKEPGERVQTTLDGHIQRRVRGIVNRHLSSLLARNVRDAAVLVVDNESGDVLAYVGSGGPYSNAREVDGVRARRQAGSTLKPFLYGLALERRYLTAASLLDDSPINLETASGLYHPRDYDQDYKGLVSVRTALGGSLNIPAVRALMLVGIEAFRDRLYKLGYSGITESGEYYGYSLALGSAEVSLWEQAQAYRALARGGRWTPIHLRDSATAPDRRVMSEAASFIVSDILSDRAARTVTFGLASYLNTPYWSTAKTGTSKDMRDNWCVGFSQRFTVAVWVGNFEGDAMHDVSGVTGAAPVWQEVMDAVHAGLSLQSPPAPGGLEIATIEFSPPVEPPRREWFLEKTRISKVVVVGSKSEMTRIENPANGMVIAIDPDIPPGRQRVPFSVKGANASMVLKLNGAAIGPASRDRLWEPREGTYRLSVEEENGTILDEVLFSVR